MGDTAAGLLIILIFFIAGIFCGVSIPDNISDYGGVKEECFTNKTCNDNLTCVSNICVKLEKERKDPEQSECPPATE